MANIFKQESKQIQFDASSVIAKLHLAGKSQAKSFFVVNSAIENEKPEDTVENPGNCRFNTDIKTGKFEIAFIYNHETGLFNYYKQIKLEKFKEYKTYIDIKQREVKNLQVNNKNNKPITDKPDENKEGEENKDQKSSELQNAYKALVTAVQKCFKQNKSLKIDEKSSIEEVKNTITEENKARADDLKQKVEKLNEVAEDEIKKYFEKFVGTKFYKNISSDSYVKRYFNKQVTDISKITIKNFQIIGMSEKDLEKLEQEFLKNQSEMTTIRYGFVVAVELEQIQ